MVATVERGLLERLFWSIEIAGDRPVISSTSGFCICRKNCRAYAESDSTYLRCPSAKIVSNAKDDFPLPESPVNTTILFRGISTVMFLRLWVRAPLMTIFPASSECPCGFGITQTIPRFTLGVGIGHNTRTFGLEQNGLLFQLHSVLFSHSLFN